MKNDAQPYSLFNPVLNKTYSLFNPVLNKTCSLFNPVWNKTYPLNTVLAGEEGGFLEHFGK